MGVFDRRTQAKMDFVLEETCREFVYGGDHETRKFIAEYLIDAAQLGKTTLGDLREAARRSLLTLRKSA